MQANALLLLPLVFSTPLAALDVDGRVVGPLIAWQAADLATFDPAWIHLKFVEDSRIHLVAGRFVDAAGHDLSEINTLLHRARRIRRTFAGDPISLGELKRRGESAAGRAGPNLALWFDVELPAGHHALAALLNELNARPLVEIAHPAPICEPAVLRAAQRIDRIELPISDTPDFRDQQDYLYATPVGLDAPAAWAEPGGRGAGMKFIDVELGWVLDHEDFNQNRFFHQGGAPLDPYYFDHGTAVVGEVVGDANGFGVTGFASDAQWGVVAVDYDEWPEVPHRFQEAVDNLDPGDVWLIELQMYPPGKGATPMEWLQVNYDVIWTGCWSKGVVCIEAGANGYQDLDDASWGGVFDRELRDSGAVLVGAGTPTGRLAEWFSNYGSRMDVHAWGSEIVTTGYGYLYNGGSLQTEYTNDFGGTSGASPMVTGAALCLQGISRQLHGQPMPPAMLRRLLSATGIPHLDPVKEIGPRPDLGAAVARVIEGRERRDGS